MTDSQLLHWTLYLCLAVGIVLACGGLYIAFASWLAPRVRRLQRGETVLARRPRAVVPCCPPGLGCNDPHGQFRSCRRELARRQATPAELIDLEAAWGEWAATPTRRRKDRAQRLTRFGELRDGIIARAVREAADKVDGAGAVALLQSGQVENGKGESHDRGGYNRSYS